MNKPSKNYQSDEETAHYVALNQMSEEDLKQGNLACTDYLIEYQRELGIPEYAPPNSLSIVLDSLPTIGSSPTINQQMVELYHASGLEVPTGLFDLPLYWAKPFYELMRETHWPAYQNCTIKDVFGWNLVLRFGGYLHIQFESPLPHKDSHWPEVGEFIVELHRRMEPGPHTPEGRLCEFLV
ncbi:hypothetical protein SH580_17100 [Coraliomargarita algicola]|uniref:Uncharacterized protein n=1 Tax=Coraliomargarita algicola TaxID=3092156 RepID=A0ABZ0RG45_9BACT|nr:hypothetical protein [Coraliomargarita sp. J2-16]WPJ95144.1 hypothetical protein SH580_17100 [Coraliomargarita sp. J2-16]